MLSGKTFMVTGATGRLGCDLVPRLEELGANVIPIVLEGYPDFPKRAPWTAETGPAVVKNADGLRSLPEPDYIIHLHWRVDRSLTFTDQLFNELDYAINRILFLWEWIRTTSCKKIVNISSVKVFSHLNGSTVSAATEPRPITPYGIAKLTAEKFLDAFFCSSGPEVIHLRLGSVASWGEHPSQLMTRLFRSCFLNEHIQINAAHRLNIMYIDDAIDLIINTALTSTRRCCNIAGKSNTVGALASEFERVSLKRLNAEYLYDDATATDPHIDADNPLMNARWVRQTDVTSMMRNIIVRYRRELDIGSTAEPAAQQGGITTGLING